MCMLFSLPRHKNYLHPMHGAEISHCGDILFLGIYGENEELAKMLFERI